MTKKDNAKYFLLLSQKSLYKGHSCQVKTVSRRRFCHLLIWENACYHAAMTVCCLLIGK